MMRPTPLLLLLLFGISLACSADRRSADSTAVRDSVRPAVPPVSAATTDGGCTSMVLADSAAGPVRLGMRVEDIALRCPGTHDSSGTQEGMPARTLVVPVGLAGTDTVAASIVAGGAWRLAVTTPGLRTRDSLGVGTRLTRLLALPGAHALTGEGSTFVVAERPCGLSFELDAFAKSANPDSVMLRRMAGRGVRVKRVLITGCGTP